MTRSPLAYPLRRGADADAGGAADLQTDIMRFMAILSLCLVAIFALVQSIPMNPSQPARPAATPPASSAVTARETVTETGVPEPVARAEASSAAEPLVALTRPKWVPKPAPRKALETPAVPPAAPPVTATELAEPLPEAATAPPAERETEGFTLRFESDAALMRLVAASRIGLYAMHGERGLRMTVSENRISFWDASTPNTFHEMEGDTVPESVTDALGRTGVPASDVRWGVTLPGKFKTELDSLMLEHRGGALIITAGGEIRWEAS